MVQLPGILRAEGFRVAPVWLRHGHRAKRVELTGLDADSDLREVVGHAMERRQVSAEGLVISARLAAALHLQVGDRVEVALLEGRRNVFTLPVTATVDDLLGLGAYVERQALSRHLGESPAISGVHLRIDTRMAEPLYRRLKRLPAISSVIVRSAVLESIGNTLDRTFVISSWSWRGLPRSSSPAWSTTISALRFPSAATSWRACECWASRWAKSQPS
ncbi:hypothetical protein PO002_34785 [Cupriavidus necator]|uniref:hypothetical protein n=1 Tax=Cupriavidus necator TaxID=106590 RepID=UPI0039C2F557